MDWTIVVPTVPARAESLARLQASLRKQTVGLPVECMVIETPSWMDGGPSIGEKVGAGVRNASGRYVSVVDDDDEVSEDYVVSVMAKIKREPDVVTFAVCIPKRTSYSLRATSVADNMTMANHLCAWRRDLALKAPYLPRNYGWDRVWYRCMRVAHPDPVELHIPRVLYTYNHSEKGSLAQNDASVAKSQADGGNTVLIYTDNRGLVMAGNRLSCMHAPDGEVMDCRDDVDWLSFIEEVRFT